MSKFIRVSDEVWDYIAKHGKFGDTLDTVMRRLLHLPLGKPGKKPYAPRPDTADRNRARKGG